MKRVTGAAFMTLAILILLATSAIFTVDAKDSIETGVLWDRVFRRLDCT